MLRQLSTGHYVWNVASGKSGSISPQLVEKLRSWKQTRPWNKEAGGIILGFIDKDTNGLLAEEITFPGVGDKRSRNSFFRGPRHQKEAEMWNKSTSGHGTQLGLWHTHPERYPTPSAPDFFDCKNVLSFGSLTAEGLLYVIVGTVLINVWYAAKDAPLIFLGAIDA